MFPLLGLTHLLLSVVLVTFYLLFGSSLVEFLAAGLFFHLAWDLVAPRLGRRLRERLIKGLPLRREPNLYIGGKADPYLIRWYMIPRNKFFNIYLHNFRRSDDDRALHDHPWWNVSILLEGEYDEVLPDRRFKGYAGAGPVVSRRVGVGGIVFRLPTAAHRVSLLVSPATRREKPVWTLFLTGPYIREWGFLCPKGWRLWKEFVANSDQKGVKESKVGPGCE